MWLQEGKGVFRYDFCGAATDGEGKGTSRLLVHPLCGFTEGIGLCAWRGTVDGVG